MGDPDPFKNEPFHMRGCSDPISLDKCLDRIVRARVEASHIGGVGKKKK
jgi:hypothetical protein